MTSHIGVNLNAICDNGEEATRTVEALNRIAVGLALDDITVTVTIAKFELSEEDTPAQ